MRDAILVLNAGSSSLKFAVFCDGDFDISQYFRQRRLAVAGRSADSRPVVSGAVINDQITWEP